MSSRLSSNGFQGVLASSTGSNFWGLHRHRRGSMRPTMVTVGTWKKRAKTSKAAAPYLEEKHDRLTELPEPILHRILSYLSMEDVIRTSVLAKRWQCIWLSVPCLNFTPAKRPRNREVAFINRSLLLHKGPKIQKLNMSFKYSNKAEAHQVDSWIQFASTRNVDELYLDFLYTGGSHCYNLPHFIFSCRSLTVLALKRCDIQLPVNIKLSSLKILSLEQVSLFGGAIDNLISSSPVIECLTLTNCERSGNLDIFIMNVGMKTLKIHESDQCSSSSNLEVYAPFIVSFELITCMSRKNYVIKRMQSLESASFDCSKLHAYCHQLTEDEGNTIIKILDNICHVKDLRLGSCYIQALSIREEQNLDSLSFDVICLRISTGFTKLELPGIAYMLRHSPNIETLIISIDEVKEIAELKNKSNCKFNFEEGEYWKLQEPNFIDLLWNLKTVRIYNFMKNLNIPRRKHMNTTIEEFVEQLQNDMNFLRFLLKNSNELEGMVITTCKRVKFGKLESKKLKLLFLLTQELLAFPRASREAEISFG